MLVYVITADLDKGEYVSSSKCRKPLTVVGMVLLLNGFVFLVVTFAMQSSPLWGPAIACLVTGVPLLIVGLAQKSSLNKESSDKP